MCGHFYSKMICSVDASKLVKTDEAPIKTESLTANSSLISQDWETVDGLQKLSLDPCPIGTFPITLKGAPDLQIDGINEFIGTMNQTLTTINQSILLLKKRNGRFERETGEITATGMGDCQCIIESVQVLPKRKGSSCC